MLRTLTPVYGATSSGVAMASPCQLINLQGYYRGGVDGWLQIHDSSTVPADNAVPLKSYALPANLAYSWKFDPGELVLRTGLYVCVSTSEGTKTLSASLADFLIDIEEYEVHPAGTTDVGDLTTAMTSLKIWSRLDPTKRLVRAQGANNSANTRYLLMFAGLTDESSLVDGVSKPIFAKKVLTGATFDLRFGNTDGFIPYFQSVINAGTYSNTNGCLFAWSTNVGVWADPAADEGTLLVTYRSL